MEVISLVLFRISVSSLSTFLISSSRRTFFSSTASFSVYIYRSYRTFELKLSTVIAFPRRTVCLRIYLFSNCSRSIFVRNSISSLSIISLLSRSARLYTLRLRRLYSSLYSCSAACPFSIYRFRTPMSSVELLSIAGVGLRCRTRISSSIFAT